MLRIAFGLLCLCGLVAGAPPASADDGAEDRRDAGKARQVAKPVYGKTLAQWTAHWWEWALRNPVTQNPISDETGEFCNANQRFRRVFFLAGTDGTPVEAERECQIPANKAILFPLVNTLWIDCPNTEDEDLSNREVREILSNFTAGGDLACQLSASVDGVPVTTRGIPIVRTQTAQTFIPNAEPLDWGCPFGDLEVGNRQRAIGEGFWVMLPPLSPGEHTLHLHGAGCNFDNADPVFFETDVTYHLDVRGRRDN